MKKGLSLLVFAFIFLFLISSVSAANWYINGDNTVTAGNGSSWSSPWRSPSDVNWNNVQPGDTIWIAGGSTYNSGFSMEKSGTASQWINIKRATSANHGSNVGWKSSYDQTVNIIDTQGFSWGTSNVGSYINVDGVVDKGIAVRYIDVNWDNGAIFFYTGGMHHINFTNVDLSGPSNNNPVGDNGVIVIRPSSGVVSYLTVSNSEIHGAPNMVYILGANHHLTFDHVKFYDNHGDSIVHANIFYVYGQTSDVVIKNSEFTDWQVEGFSLGALGTNTPWYFYNNIIHNPIGSPATFFWLVHSSADAPCPSGITKGPIYLYGNTFVNLNDGDGITSSQGKSCPFTSTSKARNNIYLNSGWASSYSIADSSNNYVTSSSSILNSNYHLNGALSGADNSLGSPYDIDPDGVIRGQDGVWDIGAYEFSACTNCRYVRQGATGTNNGSDWTNAYTSLPATLTRGFTYYIADGIYSGYTFDDAVSGTQYITIKKATTTDHGTNTGWQVAFGDSQAIIVNDNFYFITSNYIIDGMVGSGDDPSSYGFYFDYNVASGGSIRPIETTSSSSNLNISHVAVDCPGSAGDIQQFGFSGYGDNIFLSNVYVNNCQVSIWSQGDDWTIENSYFGTHWSSSANHGVQVMGVNRFIFRNNFVSYCAPMCVEPAGGCTTYMSDSKFYNNIFANVVGSNGVMKGACNGGFTNTQVYGNTVVNSDGPLLYQNNEGGGSGSGNIVRNNLLYDAPSIVNEAGGGPIVQSNNLLISGSNPSPFINLNSGDYRLSTPTIGGYGLASPYNVDILGVQRGNDGTWDIGAYEFNSGGSTSINGVCSLTLNTCTAGTLNNIADNATHYLWNCNGLNGGTTATCSQVIPTSAPSITTQPASVSTYTGLAASFSVVAAANPAASYQWQKFNGATWTNVGTNADIFTTASLTLSDSGSQYRVNVSNSIGSVLSSVVTLTVTTAPPVPLIGLIAYYNFDNNVLNQMGGGFDGTITGNPVYTTGRIGSSIDLDGNDYVTIGDLDVNPLTVSFWFSPDALPATGAWSSLIMKAYAYGLEFSGSTLNAEVGNGASSWTSVTDTGFANGNWYYVTMTYDGTSLRYYKNGVQVGSTVAATLTANNQPLMFGSWDGAMEFFSGKLDEVRIYNRALDQTEINALYVYNGSTSSFDNFIYHPSDNNPANKVISAVEVSSYISNYFASSVTLVESLYTLTLFQQGGSYRNTSISSGCDTSPWNCWTIN